jgi:hypothetical protein
VTDIVHRQQVSAILLAMKFILPLALSFTLVACSSEVYFDEHPTQPSEDALVSDRTVLVAEHTVKCGCVIDEVGHCGNYISIDGAFLPIANGKDMGLGNMEWCGQGAVSIQAAGSVQDGAFIATALDTDG